MSTEFDASPTKTAVEIMSRGVVKPFSRTPPHLRNFELSLLDQLMPPWLYCNFLVFYAADSSRHGVSHKLATLKESLSETLVLFYPLAGSLKNSTTIQCNDAGVAFLEARVNTWLSEFLDKPTSDLLNRFFPFNDAETMEKFGNPMLLVQVTFFRCGGFVLAASPSHKLMDAPSMCTFLKTWAKVTAVHNGHEGSVISVPEFLGSSVVAPNKNFPDLPLKASLPDNSKFATRRFVFSGSKINALKSSCKSIATSGEKLPSRVEVVQALVLKCAVRAASRTHPGPSVVFQTLNLRNRIKPPVGEETVGNLNWTPSFFIEEGPLDIEQIIRTMRRGVKEFFEEKAGRFNQREGADVMMEGLKERAAIKGRAGENFYAFTSLCRFPFYDIDFGWGKPAWITNPTVFRNMCYMVDSRSGEGIEAWMTMDQEVMEVLERNREFLAYATIDAPINPSRSRM
ncbi:hypothetical protein MLD38_006792 [Melastoma candidum]|uniref:Uncharacterized protein n=1 Tax=Melastoma candidum TaxID=119954 RepID=A0ACB9RNQ3_9MYRT|nr:hypothetical protein MLD38_006792 [Melastoma candidum]